MYHAGFTFYVLHVMMQKREYRYGIAKAQYDRDSTINIPNPLQITSNGFKAIETVQSVLILVLHSMMQDLVVSAASLFLTIPSVELTS